MNILNYLHKSIKFTTNTMKPHFKITFKTSLLLYNLTYTTSTKNDADQYWPQWRGPSQTGVAPSANPPTTWSESENVKWKVSVPGSGNATPIIWEDKIFIQTAIPTGKKTEPTKTDASSPAAPSGA